jgi:hypothetical protein
LNGHKEVAAECCFKIGEFCRSLGLSLADDPRLAEGGGYDPVTMGLILLLANAVADDENWSGRHEMFHGFGNTKWPNAVTVRERIEELLDGIGLRADHWNLN